MPTTRKITRQEWNKTPRDFKGISTILVCRHCDAWVFKSRPDLIPAECASTAGHEWTERKQRTMLARDERGTFLEFVEVVEMDELEFAMVSPAVTPGKCLVDGRVVSTWEMVSLTWGDVYRLLGRQYKGPQDDPLIISRLKELGIVPKWIDDEGAEVKAGVYGWDVLSPEWSA